MILMQAFLATMSPVLSDTASQQEEDEGEEGDEGERPPPLVGEVGETADLRSPGNDTVYLEVQQEQYNVLFALFVPILGLPFEINPKSSY